MKIILVSETNIASSNIGKILLNKHPFKKSHILFMDKPVYKLGDILVVFTERNVIDIDELEEPLSHLKPDVIVVASTHKSEQEVSSLTCHSPGNWGPADMGGKPKQLSIAPALFLRACLLELADQKDEKNLDYEVSLEVTHHGPSYSLPIMFAEVGSSEKQWKDMEACEAVADTIFKILTSPLETVPTTVFIGGGHYAPTPTRRVLSGRIAIGHMCPKYQIEHLDSEMLLQAIDKTTPRPAFVTIEWKSFVSAERERLIELLKENNISWKKDKEI